MDFLTNSCPFVFQYKLEARGDGQEEQPHARVRGGSRQEQPHVQGAVAARAQEGLEEPSHVEGQEGRR